MVNKDVYISKFTPLILLPHWDPPQTPPPSGGGATASSEKYGSKNNCYFYVRMRRNNADFNERVRR